MANATLLRIEPLHTVEHCHEVEEVQRQAWGIHDNELEVVPTHMLLTIAHNSGIMLGCRDETGRLLGFVYSFLAFEDGPEGRRLKQHSHQMGVVPEARSLGLGQRLKLAQREAALAQGIELITWTYDPLEPVNARLNIGRLRAVARRYERNLYGDLGGINAGIPTDRFEVEWWLASQRVHSSLGERPAPPVAPRRLSGGHSDEGLPLPFGGSLPLDGEPLALEVPANYQQVKRRDPALALAWRLSSRAWFEQAFAAGYAASEAWQEDGRAFYELSPFGKESVDEDRLG